MHMLELILYKSFCMCVCDSLLDAVTSGQAAAR